MDSTVLFILSANYSGSTWLALLLGSHSQAFYVGELKKMFRDTPVPCRLCEERHQACPVFHDVAAIKARDIHHLVLARTGKNILVDNSKTVSWSRTFSTEDRFHRQYLHLLRDPRAIAYSRQLRRRPAGLADWIDTNNEILAFVRDHKLEQRMMTYNELADNTDETLSQLCHWLGVAYEPGQKEYWHFEHHGAGRNGATAAFLEQFVASEENFYAETRRTQFHDLRWKEQLDEQTQKAIIQDPQLKTFLRNVGLECSESGLNKLCNV